MSQLQICEDDLRGRKIADFLCEHLENMKEITPPESVHALDLEALRSPDITFWTAWEGDELLGCGALKQLDSRSGEIKSMRTAKAHRRKGIAGKILEHIIKEAERRAYDCLNLEQGFCLSSPRHEPCIYGMGSSTEVPSLNTLMTRIACL